ncbi:MAG: hypothetical protein AAGG07_08945 [Planctomycetota bacterium]
MQHEDERSPQDALRHFRRFKQGVLLADGRPWRTRFIVDPVDGAVLMPIDPEVRGADELVLHIPDEGFDAMQALLEQNAFIDGDPGAIADRFMGYHGEPESAIWLRSTLAAARWDGTVVDGDDLAIPNALRSAEPALLRALNSDREVLRAALHGLGVEVESPTAVGVDPMGFDVRAAFGIVRAEPGEDMRDGEAARRVVESLLASV